MKYQAKFIHFYSKKKHLKTSSAKWRPFCLSLNVLIDALYLVTIDMNGTSTTTPWPEVVTITWLDKPSPDLCEFSYISIVLIHIFMRNKQYTVHQDWQ